MNTSIRQSGRDAYSERLQRSKENRRYCYAPLEPVIHSSHFAFYWYNTHEICDLTNSIDAQKNDWEKVADRFMY
jgi:hypothetical protein